MFEQAFKNIDDILHKDAGCGSELDYVEQTSWILFLKYLDDLEKDKKSSAELSGKIYTAIIEKQYRWETWAMPKGSDGKLDNHKALTGDDLKDFVDLKLFPYLKKFKADAERADTIEYKIGEIFSELKTGFKVVTTLEKSSTALMSFASVPRQRNMKCLTFTRIKSKTWAMLGVMAVSIIRLVHLSRPLLKWLLLK